MAPDARTLLAAYDAELRVEHERRLPRGAAVERDGPLQRCMGVEGGGFVVYRDLAGVEGAELDALIARQVRAFAERGEPFEWKLHGHDLPPDLAARLRAAGLEPEETETVMIAEVAAAAEEPRLPAGVTLREVHERADLDRIAALESEIWTADRAWLARSLEAELATAPAALTILVAEAAGTVVSAGWVRFVADSGFATLWGGGTLPAWRGRGIYRALVAHRANLALRRGFSHLEVDASDDSRPVLERLGFIAITTTTPFVWTPGSG
jgi:GNAT superfamily N-acetyltransferase